jgi:hypothetical protein
MAGLYARALSALRSLARRLLNCDCAKPLQAAELSALRRAHERCKADLDGSPVQSPAPRPEWAPLAEAADEAIDALWKVPHDLRGLRWYDAVYYCRDVREKALAARAAAAAPGQGAP